MDIQRGLVTFAAVAGLGLSGCGSGEAASSPASEDKTTTEATRAPITNPFSKGPNILQGIVWTAVALPEAQPEDIARSARNFCSNKDNCKVLVWQSRDNVPRKLPMVTREADSLAFSYTLNRATDTDEAAWNCKIWPGKPEECLASAD